MVKRKKRFDIFVHSQQKGRMQLKPTKTFKNELPEIVKTWTQVFYHFYDQSKQVIEDIPPDLKWEVIRANRQLYLYEFDLDFIKARMFDEAFPIVHGLFNEIKGGKNYSRWEQLLRDFYNRYNKLRSPE